MRCYPFTVNIARPEGFIIQNAPILVLIHRILQGACISPVLQFQKLSNSDPCAVFGSFRMHPIAPSPIMHTLPRYAKGWENNLFLIPMQSSWVPHSRAFAAG